MKETAREIARDLPDGTYKVLGSPEKIFRWHEPKTHVPSIQWSARTGVTRYEWERRITPVHQREVFEYLRATYAQSPPVPLREADAVGAQVQQLENGLYGVDPTASEVARQRTILVEVDGWRFSIHAEDQGEDRICDYVLVKHADLRTVADWNLLVRVRSWVFDDSRTAFMLMPGSDGSSKIENYANAGPNTLQIVSPRPSVAS